jgi:hypothetical protein
LEKLGFPWILSSESRLINGLHDIFTKIFPRALVVAKQVSRRHKPTMFVGGMTGSSWGKLNRTSDFLQ